MALAATLASVFLSSDWLVLGQFVDLERNRLSVANMDGCTLSKLELCFEMELSVFSS